jgi:hypothetical protein
MTNENEEYINSEKDQQIYQFLKEHKGVYIPDFE